MEELVEKKQNFSFENYFILATKEIWIRKLVYNHTICKKKLILVYDASFIELK